MVLIGYRFIIVLTCLYQSHFPMWWIILRVLVFLWTSRAPWHSAPHIQRVSADFLPCALQTRPRVLVGQFALLGFLHKNSGSSRPEAFLPVSLNNVVVDPWRQKSSQNSALLMLCSTIFHSISAMKTLFCDVTPGAAAVLSQSSVFLVA